MKQTKTNADKNAENTSETADGKQIIDNHRNIDDIDTEVHVTLVYTNTQGGETEFVGDLEDFGGGDFCVKQWDDSRDITSTGNIENHNGRHLGVFKRIEYRPATRVIDDYRNLDDLALEDGDDVEDVTLVYTNTQGGETEFVGNLARTAGGNYVVKQWEDARDITSTGNIESDTGRYLGSFDRIEIDLWT
jgi:hypothetical protein